MLLLTVVFIQREEPPPAAPRSHRQSCPSGRCHYGTFHYPQLSCLSANLRQQHSLLRLPVGAVASVPEGRVALSICLSLSILSSIVGPSSSRGPRSSVPDTLHQPARGGCQGAKASGTPLLPAAVPSDDAVAWRAPLAQARRKHIRDRQCAAAAASRVRVAHVRR